MSDNQRPIDWRKTTFDGSRREQLRQAQRMTVRQRLEALEQLTELSERLQAMPRQTAAAQPTTGVQEPPPDYRTDASRNDISSHILDGQDKTVFGRQDEPIVTKGHDHVVVQVKGEHEAD
jgi:hypothetical protein